MTTAKGGCPKKWTPEVLEEVAEALIEFSRQPQAICLEQFCRDNPKWRIWPQRMSEWANENQLFAEAKKVAETNMAANIAEATATGESPPAFGIFCLKQRGWTDKVEAPAVTINMSDLRNEAKKKAQDAKD